MALIPVLLCVTLPGPAASEEAKKSVPGDIILGLGAGYSSVLGHYGGMLNGSYRVGASLMYGNAGILRYLMGELEAGYSRYPLKQSRSSYLESVMMSVGPVAYLPAATWLQLYAGASFRGTYLHLRTATTGRNEKTVKPGFEAKAGMFFPVGQGFRLRCGVDYTLEFLSGKALHGVTVSGGLSYNFNPAERTGGALPGDPADRVDWYLARADRALAEGRTEEAKKYFASVLAIDRNNATAREKVTAIAKAEGDYSSAMKLSAQKRYFDALPLLEEAGAYLERARAEERNIRKLLAGEIAPLEKQGISLYESGDYRGCIAVMKRLLLIDPKNRTGLIYLPRAQKRQEAMERFR
jgi:tetratricopeptide (TPR) repeat protein